MEKGHQRNWIENDEKIENYCARVRSTGIKQRKKRKFVCQREDVELTKTGSNIWKVQGVRECIFGRESSKKIEMTESDILINMELASLDKQSVEERLHSADTRTGWYTENENLQTYVIIFISGTIHIYELIC